MALDSKMRRRLLVVGGILALATALALIFSLTDASARGVEQRVPWEPIFRQHFKRWYASAVLALAVIWFCGRNRLEHGKARWVFVHIGAGLVFSWLHMFGTAWLVAGEQSVKNPGQILTFSYLLERVGKEYFSLGMSVYWMTVFGHLVWNYYERFREREIMTRQLAEARLEALRMQLNPHFLFNTLHAISSLIHDQPDAADRMVARLSELLRQTLDASKPQEVPLREELAFLDGYLEIEQTRFAEHLQVSKEIEAGTEAALVPFLLLQPLVENAIRHGIEPRLQSGRLSISARRRGDGLELRVRDDGPGLAGKTVNAKGIGLSNTRSRLQHLYGRKFTFELKDLAEGGLEACIILPFHTDGTAN